MRLLAFCAEWVLKTIAIFFALLGVRVASLPGSITAADAEWFLILSAWAVLFWLSGDEASFSIWDGTKEEKDVRI